MKRWTRALIGITLVLSVSASTAAEVRLGQEAPDFILTDVQGRQHELSGYRGQFVVLEWLNPECPFVRKHYGSGNMQKLQEEAAEDDVVWLSINSSAPGKQGHLTLESGKAFIEAEEAEPAALLLDPEGVVGRLYGAKTTPHMFVINPEGSLIYQGAIDDRPTADPADIKGARNYVQRALEQALGGEPVEASETQSYGCSIKYGGQSWIDKLIKR